MYTRAGDTRMYSTYVSVNDKSVWVSLSKIPHSHNMSESPLRTVINVVNIPSPSVCVCTGLFNFPFCFSPRFGGIKKDYFSDFGIIVSFEIRLVLRSHLGHPTNFFFTFFWRARMCGLLLCLCHPYCIFERFLDSNPESCRSTQACNQLSHPSPYLATQ